MERQVSLTVLKGGIDRLRTKGSAKIEHAYDLLNCYVTHEGTIKVRPGSLRDAELPAGTIGLVAFDGKLHVFASTAVSLTAYPDYELDILLHPTDLSAAVSEIHFAKPFLGALYVVAEFDDGAIYDYWLQPADAWAASTEYSYNDFVVPTTANGYVYRATRYGNSYPSWSAGVLRTVGNGSSIEPSRIEPTVYNEYYYEAVDTDGDNPRSGTVEPSWPTNDGEQVIENTDGSTPTTADEATPPSPPEPNTPQTSSQQKYAR